MQCFLYPILFRPFYPEKKYIISLYRGCIKSPTYETSSCEISKMWMCVYMCNHIKLVHVSGVLIVQINSVTNSMQ